MDDLLEKIREEWRLKSLRTVPIVSWEIAVERLPTNKKYYHGTYDG
jgi:hypothetical protein